MKGWKPKLSRGGWLILSVGVIFFFLVWSQAGRHNQKPVPTKSFSALVKQIKAGQVKSVSYDVYSFKSDVTLRSGTHYNSVIIGSEGVKQLYLAANSHNTQVSGTAASDSSWIYKVIALSPQLLIFILVIFLLSGKLNPFGRSNLVTTKPSGLGFKDVAGCDEAIEELSEIREFLTDPKRFQALGARVPKGVLLYGPPGTGKTLLARAVAEEAEVPFFSASGSEFIEMFAGLGANRVRKLFKEAKKQAPAIIFIDELDAVGRSRSSSGGDGGTREADQTLNQLLTEMDGFSVSEHPVVVIAASNRVDVLDSALTRPGRFDRRISVSAPDRQGRLEILKIHSRGKPFAKEANLEALAAQTSGMTGAELANVLNEAALHAARRNASEIGHEDIEDGLFRVVAGAKKQNRIINERERALIAYHEAGHALAAETLATTDRVHKVSIIQRGESGGQTFWSPEEDNFLLSREMLLDRIAVLMAGRAAEKEVLGQVTSGAATDLKQATEMARTMVTRLGMGEVLGLVSIDGGPIASEIEAKIDAEVSKILNDQYKRAKEIVIDKERTALERIANSLLEKETIDRDQLLALIAGSSD
jgi:cell division protease FtsH